VHNTKQIKDFHLLHHTIYDKKRKAYLIVGCVGERAEERLRDLEMASR
jgi:hypothetical protein